MFLRSKYWEDLRYKMKSSDTTKVEAYDHYLLRYNIKGNKAILNHADFLRGNFTELVDEITAFYTDKNKSFTITLYDYINSDDDMQYLLDHGFQQMETYQTMVAPIVSLSQPLSSDFVIKEVPRDQLLDDDQLAISLRCFPTFFNTLDDVREIVKNRIQRAENDPHTDLVNFAAYDPTTNKPVANASLQFHADWFPVASLSGASVLPEYRRQGIYSQLLYNRAVYAEQHNLTHLMIEANITTSGPIAAAKGFVKVNQFIDFQYHL